MGWPYETYQIPCEQGGFTGKENLDTIEPQQMLWPSRNINLNKGGREARGGTVHVDTVASSGKTEGRGIFDYTTSAGVQYIMRAWSDGEVWKNASAAIATGLSTTNRIHFEMGGGNLYMADGSGLPRIWTGGTGSATSVTGSASNWATNAPMQMIRHGRGAIERMWAICKDGVYCAGSASGLTDFSDANATYIPIDTTDANGITGGVTYGDELFVHSRNKFYAIDDSSPVISEWGYKEAAWEGGAAHWRVVVKCPIGLLAMAEDSDVYIVNSVPDYGNYKATSIMRPAYVDEWLKEYCTLTSMSSFHAVHDPALRAVKWFVLRDGYSEIQTCLVFFYDRDPKEAWMIHDGSTSGSGYNASASCRVRKSAGTFKIYTQDYDGMVWELENATKSDNGVGYYKGFTTPHLTIGNARQTKKFQRGWVTITPVGNYNLSIRPLVDGETQLDVQEINMGSNAGVLGSFVLGADILGGQELIDRSFEMGDMGKRVQLEVFNRSAGEDFFISTVMIDTKVLSSRPVE